VHGLKCHLLKGLQQAAMLAGAVSTAALPGFRQTAAGPQSASVRAALTNFDTPIVAGESLSHRAG